MAEATIIPKACSDEKFLVRIRTIEPDRLKINESDCITRVLIVSSRLYTLNQFNFVRRINTKRINARSNDRD